MLPFYRQYFFLLFLFTSFYPFASYSKAAEINIITNQLDRPWSLALLPDGGYLVTEKTGQLRRVNAQGQLSEPIAGLPEVSVVGQGGLLDVILHPNFSSNQWLYISFVSGSAVKGYSTEVVRATLKDNQLTDVIPLFVALPKTKGGRHFGSRLVFDNDGYLYIGLGDRGVKEQSQQLQNHHGSIIRLHDDGRIPQDNPFVNTKNALPEIFSYGHRNIQGLALHPITGEVWAHEHGPQGGDELNKISVGKNYGWPVITYGVNYGIGTKIGEGTHKQGMQQPSHYWTPSIAPSGLAFYQNKTETAWLVGALKFQLLAMLTPSPENDFSEQRYFEGQFGRIRDVRTHGDTIYLLTDSGQGKLIKIKF